MAFCVWLLSFGTMFLRRMYIVAGVSVSFLFTTESYSIEWIGRGLFIHSYIDGHWGCFPLLATVISADRLIFACLHVLCKKSHGVCVLLGSTFVLHHISEVGGTTSRKLLRSFLQRYLLAESTGHHLPSGGPDRLPGFPRKSDGRPWQEPG